jgi:hypothetical protein
VNFSIALHVYACLNPPPPLSAVCFDINPIFVLIYSMCTQHAVFFFYTDTSFLRGLEGKATVCSNWSQRDMSHILLHEQIPNIMQLAELDDSLTSSQFNSLDKEVSGLNNNTECPKRWRDNRCHNTC